MRRKWPIPCIQDCNEAALLFTVILAFQVRSLNSKLPQDERENATIVIDHAGPPPDAFQQFIEISPVAATLAMHYTLQVHR